jgi:nucleoside-diphosphate-sugar epimerase
MKILITGHKGFVGRYFMRALEGNDILGVDIKDGYDCRSYFKASDTQYDLVIHLAAIVGGRETIEGRPLAVADNFSIDSEFFQWCLKTKPKKVVYFSSSAAYPVQYQVEGNERRLREDMQTIYEPRKPDMTYGWSKLVGEYLASFVDNVYIFRPFSGYGSDQDLTYPFPKYIEKALASSDTFEVWGSGKQTRDFIHIEDIVSAVLVAIEDKPQGAINLGWGRKTSFLDLAQMCMDAVGVQKEIVTRPDKPVGCMHRVSDNTKLLTFYEPKITLEEGIERAIVEYLQ